MGFLFHLNFTVTAICYAFAVAALSWIALFDKEHDQSEDNIDDSASEFRPSPSLVPLPLHFTVGSIKDRLPVMEYNCFLERSQEGRKEKSSPSPCVVCLRNVNGSDEIRVLANCSHIFHRECVDGWIDQGRMTCPCCRSKLLGEQIGKFRRVEDPWRKERMVYLFGEDYVFCNNRS